MKKMMVYLLGTVLLIAIAAGCAPKGKEEVITDEKDDAKKEQPSIVPSYQLSEDNYKTILPFRSSKARGVITNQLANRLDIDEIEEGLQRHSVQVYNPKDYYFEEGQYLTEETVYEWLGRKEKGEDGLNPSIKNDASKKEQEEKPRYISHILEQNYLKKKDDDSVELAGVSIALAMKSVYRFQTETGGPYYYKDIPHKEMIEKSEEIAQEVINRMRKIKGLKNVPIYVMLYKEEEQSAPVPGNFVQKTSVGKGETKIAKWEAVKEKYVLFPSGKAKKKHFEDYETIMNFGKDISTYFPNYVGMVGEGFYINDELQQVKLDIPIEFYGKSEVTGFTQYAYGLIKDKFPTHYDIELQISSNKKLESLITRDKGEKEPTVHILH